MAYALAMHHWLLPPRSEHLALPVGCCSHPIAPCSLGSPRQVNNSVPLGHECWEAERSAGDRCEGCWGLADEDGARGVGG